MSEEFRIVKRIKRFSKWVSVAECCVGESRVRIQIIEDDVYKRAYEKIHELTDKVLKNSDIKIEADILIAFADDKWISFLYNLNGIKHCFNYCLESGYFERDKVVLKERRIRKSDIRQAIAKSGKKLRLYKYSTLIIANGVELIFEDEENTVIKIRRNVNIL